jgi:hypothetical protein
MKRVSIILIVLILLIIIAGGFLLLKQNNNFNLNKEVNLNISNVFPIFEECINYYPQSQFYCPNVDNTDLDKLKSLANQKGIIRCNSGYGSNYQYSEYQKCNSMLENCDEIFSISYHDMGMVESIIHSYSIYICRGKQYYVKSGTAPPSLMVAEIQLGEDAINKLK